MYLPLPVSDGGHDFPCASVSMCGRPLHYRMTCPIRIGPGSCLAPHCLGDQKPMTLTQQKPNEFDVPNALNEPLAFTAVLAVIILSFPK